MLYEWANPEGFIQNFQKNTNVPPRKTYFEERTECGAVTVVQVGYKLYVSLLHFYAC